MVSKQENGEEGNSEIESLKVKFPSFENETLHSFVMIDDSLLTYIYSHFHLHLFWHRMCLNGTITTIGYGKHDRTLLNCHF